MKYALIVGAIVGSVLVALYLATESGQPTPSIAAPASSDDAFRGFKIQ